MPALTATVGERAQDRSRRIRAQAEQRIIDSECYATKLALANDKIAWRAYQRRSGEPAKHFIPYST